MKYPKMKYLPFSPIISKEDKIIPQEELNRLLGVEVVITEKLDGGNCCLSNGKVYARSHSEETKHESFDYIKKIYKEKYAEHLELGCFNMYGENMFAVHSIEYTKLYSYFFLFSISVNNCFMNWDMVNSIGKHYKFNVVPVVYKGIFNSVSDIEELMNEEMKKESLLGGEREGFVIRISDLYNVNDTSKIAKYVRKDHVQTDVHWSKNWRQAILIGDEHE